MIETPISEKEWQARCDAQTLGEAEVIKADKARHDAAQTAAAKLAAEKGEEKKAMVKVAGRKTAPNPKKAAGSMPQGSKAPPSAGTAGRTSAFNVFEKL